MLKSNSKWKYYRKLKRPQLVLGAFSCGSNAGSLRVTHTIPSALGKEVACTSDSCGNLFTIVFAMFPSLCGLPRCSHSERAHVSLWLPRGGFSASDNTREQVRADCPQWPWQWKTLYRAPRVEARQGEVRRGTVVLLSQWDMRLNHHFKSLKTNKQTEKKFSSGQGGWSRLFFSGRSRETNKPICRIMANSARRAKQASPRSSKTSHRACEYFMTFNLGCTHLHSVLSVTLPMWKSYSLVRIRITCEERTFSGYKTSLRPQFYGSKEAITTLVRCYYLGVSLVQPIGSAFRSVPGSHSWNVTCPGGHPFIFKMTLRIVPVFIVCCYYKDAFTLFAAAAL